jgi:putative phosphoribosyl transferase
MTISTAEPIRFANRRDAGRRLAALLGDLRDEHPVVVGIPRGGVPVAAEVARALDAPLDILVVRKVGAPQNPEYGIGALAEDGVRVVDERAVRDLGLHADELDDMVSRARAELVERQRRFRAGHAPLSVHARTAVLIDDGLATGRSAQAAARSLRERGAKRVVLAVPVAAPASAREMRGFVDQLVYVEAPPEMWAIGLWYEDFSPTSDEEVAAALDQARGSASAEVTIDGAPGVRLHGHLALPARAEPRGVVAFAHGSGSSAASPRNRTVAATLGGAGFATLLFDLLSPEEALERANVFDVDLLASRLLAATAWLRGEPDTAQLPLGYFGASTGSAAALLAAAQLGTGVRAVVSRGGRPDLAQGRLHDVLAPVLLIVGGADADVLQLNRAAQARLRGETELAVVAGATHLFEEPGALEDVARLAIRWFGLHLGSGAPGACGGEAAVA